MSTAIVARANTAPMTLAELQDVAKAFAASGYFKDAADVAKAYTKVVAGHELGIPPVQAMTGIHIVEGKPTLAAPLVGALIKRSGRYDYRVRTLTDTECVLAFFEHGQEVGESAFTLDDARKAGVGGKQVWQRYARNMLLARALTNGARWYCPDVFGGAVYTPEEMGAVVDGEGELLIEEVSPAVSDRPTTASTAAGGAVSPAAANGGQAAGEPLVLAPPEQLAKFRQLVSKVAQLDEKQRGEEWWQQLADRAAEREHGRKVNQLTDMELAAIAVEFQKHYATLQGSGGDNPVPLPEKVEPDGDDGSLPPPEQSSATESPRSGGAGSQTDGSTDESSVGAVADEPSLFKAPSGPRGSKRVNQ